VHSLAAIGGGESIAIGPMPSHGLAGRAG